MPVFSCFLNEALGTHIQRDDSFQDDSSSPNGIDGKRCRLLVGDKKSHLKIGTLVHAKFLYDIGEIRKQVPFCLMYSVQRDQRTINTCHMGKGLLP